ncbi:Glycosyltransferase involved in cell wall bisynthesis [Flavobacterium resistens]|uniref:Glycosyltransferase n=1 Tax=Flavobacterium resistens TaxID=443612 RepID=A0A521EQL4_9FLAO|nr:glycosyltransferase family 4 protein [Flavobacterium resistens]MRX67886.1 glycosyltransferase [Flavobacterium resistens]SMO86233.1 Glycosyltransferase involved in cell wall bisynthesis [Flavobacterium resistens]
MKTKETILIAHNYSEDSFASMSYYLANHLADLGNRVVFISHKPFFNEMKTIKKQKGEIIICSWPTERRPTSIKDALWYSKLYFKYKPTIVIGHFVGANIAIGLSKLLSFNSVKTFSYYHTLMGQIALDSKGRNLKRNILIFRKSIFYKFFCDVIICPSDLAQEDLKKSYNLKKGLVVLNPMKDRFQSKSIQNENKIIISYLGRLDPSKGILELVEAFVSYRTKNKLSNLFLNIAGTGSLEGKIKKMIINEEAIKFFGGISYDKVDDYLLRSHFVIIPSKIDNLPTVGLESLMNSTPLLISNFTGLANYLQDGLDCFKFDPNLESMVSLFNKVENNFPKYNEMSENARITFLEKFEISNYCNNFSNMLFQ